MMKALKYFEFCLDSIIIYGIKVKVKTLILRRQLVTFGSLSNYDDDANAGFKSTFLRRPLHNYDVKPPNLPFYDGRELATTNFPSSF